MSSAQSIKKRKGEDDQESQREEQKIKKAKVELNQETQGESYLDKEELLEKGYWEHYDIPEYEKYLVDGLTEEAKRRGYLVPEHGFSSLNDMMWAYRRGNRSAFIKRKLNLDSDHDKEEAEAENKEDLVRSDHRCVNEFLDDPAQHEPILYEDRRELGTYCFTRQELPLLAKYKLNPYTGRDLTPEFLRSIGSEPIAAGEEFASQCTEDRRQLATVYANLSESSKRYYKNWYQERYTPSSKMQRLAILPRVELGKLKRCEPIETLYRGLTFELGKNMPSFVKSQLPLRVGQNFVFESKHLSSWTTNPSIASNFAQARTFTKVHRLVLQIKNIHRDDIFYELLPSLAYYDEEEVVLLPGRYQSQIVRIFKPEDL